MRTVQELNSRPASVLPDTYNHIFKVRLKRNFLDEHVELGSRVSPYTFKKNVKDIVPLDNIDVYENI